MKRNSDMQQDRTIGLLTRMNVDMDNCHGSNGHRSSGTRVSRRTWGTRAACRISLRLVVMWKACYRLTFDNGSLYG